MEVDVHLQSLVLNGLLYDSLLRGPDRWLLLLRWIQIESVEVKPVGIESVVASRNTVWIQYGNDFENEVFPEEATLFALHIGQQVEEAIQYV